MKRYRNIQLNTDEQFEAMKAAQAEMTADEQPKEADTEAAEVAEEATSVVDTTGYENEYVEEELADNE